MSACRTATLALHRYRGPSNTVWSVLYRPLWPCNHRMCVFARRLGCLHKLAHAAERSHELKTLVKTLAIILPSKVAVSHHVFRMRVRKEPFKQSPEHQKTAMVSAAREVLTRYSPRNPMGFQKNSLNWSMDKVRDCDYLCVHNSKRKMGLTCIVVSDTRDVRTR